MYHQLERDTAHDMTPGAGNETWASGLRPLELLHPPRDRMRSGGNIYNSKLVETAATLGLPLSSRVARADEVEAHLFKQSISFRIWDSLFLDALAACDIGAARNWGLLLHYLPSTNPTLEDAERICMGAVEARVIPLAERVIVTGRRLKTHVDQMRPRGSVFVCEPGVSEPFLVKPDRNRSAASGTVALLTVANFWPGKGMLEVLAALAQLERIPWRWHVVGDRTCDAVYTRRFDAEARRLGVQNRIVHHGSLDHGAIVDLMDEVDLFVSGSRYEAYGMALAEAAARCLPAVSTDVGAAADLYRHGTTGLLANVRDARAFRMHLERLLTDRTLRDRFRDNLRRYKPRTWLDTASDLAVAMPAIG